MAEEGRQIFLSRKSWESYSCIGSFCGVEELIVLVPLFCASNFSITENRVM